MMLRRLLIILSCCVLSLAAIAASDNSTVSAKTTQSSTDQKALRQQLAATVTAAERYQQQLQTQLQALQKQNTELKQKVLDLQNKLAVTAKQTVPNTTVRYTARHVTHSNNQMDWMGKILNNPLIDLRLAVGLIVMGLLLLAWLLWYRRPKLIQHTAQQEAIEDEYDFMGSDEAIPAKLDLARAYVEMEKIAEAREVLTEIINKGNSEQRRQAEEILHDINPSIS